MMTLTTPVPSLRSLHCIRRQPTAAAARSAACRPGFARSWCRPAHPATSARRSFTAHASKYPNILDVDAETLEVEITKRDKPLIVDFHAQWCGPCLLQAKELEKVAEQLGDGVRILKLDTDLHPDISSQLQIQGLPTLIFVGQTAGMPALRSEGLMDADTIVRVVREDLMMPPLGPDTDAASEADSPES